jgi:HK97 family phage major capsid protein
VNLTDIRAAIEAQAEIARTSQNPAAIDAALTQIENLQSSARRAERVQNLGLLQAPPIDSSPALDTFIATLPKGLRSIQNVAGDVFQEAANADGAYLLPVDKKALIALINPPNLIHSLCDAIFTPSNAVTVPVDADTDWSASLAAGDVAEGVALVETKAAFGSITATLAKAGALVRVTSEMLEDSTGIGAYVMNKLARKLGWKLHARSVAAVLASGGKVTVAKTVGAAAGSAPDIDNILAMDVSMLDENHAGACWLANPKLKPALAKLVLGTVPIFLPGGFANGIPDTLLGRPIMFVEGLPAVGSAGDLVLCDPSSFFFITKTQGPRLAVSTEAEFVKDTVLYRGFVRSVCVSKWSATAARPDTSVVGNVVVLAVRA